MSGCMHPIVFNHQHVIKVNAIQFQGILGSEKARILVNSNEEYLPGDSVVISEVSVNEGIPSGKTLYRFVQFIESRIPLYLDDDALAIHLVPTRSMIEALQK